MKIKGFLKLLFSRLFAIALTVILQVVILVYYLSELSENYIYVQIISLIIVVIVFISMVNKNMHPEQKILWAFLIMAFPIIGTVLYVLFNINNPLKKKFIKYYELDIKNISNVANNKQDVYELSNGYESQFKYLEKMTGLNLNKDTNTKFLKDGKEVQVFVSQSRVSINGKKANRLIDPTIDLATEKWSHFKHHDWILDQNAPKDFYFDKSLMQKLPQSVHQK